MEEQEIIIEIINRMHTFIPHVETLAELKTEFKKLTPQEAKTRLLNQLQTEIDFLIALKTEVEKL